MSRFSRMPALSGVLLVLAQRLVHAHRYAQPSGLDRETGDGAGAGEVVEHLDAVDEVQPPQLAKLEHLAFAKAVDLLEAKG